MCAWRFKSILAAENLGIPLPGDAARSIETLLRLRLIRSMHLLHLLADFQQLLRLLLHFLLQLDVVVLHDLLDGHRAGDNVAEAGHPHVPVLLALGAKYVDSLSGLQIEDVLPLPW